MGTTTEPLTKRKRYESFSCYVIDNETGCLLCTCFSSSVAVMIRDALNDVEQICAAIDKGEKGNV